MCIHIYLLFTHVEWLNVIHILDTYHLLMFYINTFFLHKIHTYYIYCIYKVHTSFYIQFLQRCSLILQHTMYHILQSDILGSTVTEDAGGFFVSGLRVQSRISSHGRGHIGFYRC